MGRDRIIQLAMCLVAIGGIVLGGTLLGSLIETSERRALRYTDNADENMPPFVALGTAIGAFRGMIVDYLWIKANLMKDRGQFYQVMEDADLITKLQPRFAPVWVFHGHNMAYNISVATNTPEERWEWVKAGIELVRDKGLRYNPNDLELHKELSFWIGHKVDGVSDDAQMYYKREWAREWHYLLGEPPADQSRSAEPWGVDGAVTVTGVLAEGGVPILYDLGIFIRNRPRPTPRPIGAFYRKITPVQV